MPVSDSIGDRLETLIFQNVVQLIRQSNDRENEASLTAAANLAQLIKQRMQKRGEKLLSLLGQPPVEQQKSNAVTPTRTIAVRVESPAERRARQLRRTECMPKVSE